jgi:hypothetical protein
MKAFLVVLIGLAIVGCKPSKPVTAPSAPSLIQHSEVTAAEPGSPMPAPRMPARKIVGAFGWTLGDRVPDGLTLETLRDGVVLYSFETTNFPPFDRVTLSLTRDGRIRSIEGSATTDFSVAQTLLSVLANKYGKAHWHDMGTGVDDYRFVDQFSSVELYRIIESGTTTLTYNDEALMHEGDDARKAKAASEEKRMAHDL